MAGVVGAPEDCLHLPPVSPAANSEYERGDHQQPDENESDPGARGDAVGEIDVLLDAERHHGRRIRALKMAAGSLSAAG